MKFVTPPTENTARGAAVVIKVFVRARVFTGHLSVAITGGIVVDEIYILRVWWMLLQKSFVTTRIIKAEWREEKLCSLGPRW